MNETATRQLLQEAPKAYRNHINDLLLSALLQTLAEHGQTNAVLVDLEGHGREDFLGGGIDLSRTVGWFTSIYPVLLERPDTTDLATLIKAVKEQLRAIPNKGAAYGCLPHSEIDMPRPAVAFNYLGQIGAGQGGDLIGSFAPESSGWDVAPANQRMVPLDLNAIVVEGRLQMTWTVPAEMSEECGLTLARDYRANLLGLVAHCRSEEAGGVTPSDFPLARLDTETLDRLCGKGQGIEDVYPLTPAQEGMLYHILADPDSHAYFHQGQLRLAGDMDTEALRRAWSHVVATHSILRSSFHWEGLASYHQVVHNQVDLPWFTHDWRSMDANEADARLATFLADDRDRGFEPDQAPLLRFHVIHLIERDGRTCYRLIFDFSHLILDGWSMPILYRDLFLAYKTFAAGSKPGIPAAAPFGNYMNWLARQDQEQALTWWRTHLTGFRTPTDLRLAGPDPGQATGMSMRTRYLTDTDGERLNALARRWRLTLNTLVQGAWACLLARYSGEQDVVFGTTVSGRPADLEGVEEMVGMLINTLPLRVSVDENQPLKTWLEGIRADHTTANGYVFTPLVTIQKQSELEAGIPLFESIVVFENYPVDEALAEHEGPAVELLGTEHHTNYPLTLVVGPGTAHSAGMSLELTYDAARFGDGSMNRLLDHLTVLLAAMPEHTGSRLADLPMLPDEERQLVLKAFNHRETVASVNCIHETFTAQAERTPERIALQWEDETLDYAALDRVSGELAARLRARGVGPEVLVGLVADRSLEMVIGLLAILRAGGAYLPLDPETPEERFRFILEDSAAPLVLAQTHLCGDLPATAAEIVPLPTYNKLNESNAAPVPCGRSALPANTAYVIYTSGSTGRPKGTPVTHANVTRLFEATRSQFTFSEEDVWTLFHSYAFDFSVWEIWGALFHGGRLVIVPYLTSRSPKDFYQLLVDEGVTLLNQTPSAFTQLIEAAGAQEATSLRLVIFGGEALDVRTLAPWFARFGYERPRLVNMYGITRDDGPCYRSYNRTGRSAR